MQMAANQHRSPATKILINRSFRSRDLQLKRARMQQSDAPLRKPTTTTTINGPHLRPCIS